MQDIGCKNANERLKMEQTANERWSFCNDLRIPISDIDERGKIEAERWNETKTMRNAE